MNSTIKPKPLPDSESSSPLIHTPATTHKSTVWQNARLAWKSFADRVPKPIKILIATVVGVSMILVGIVLGPLPGPGGIPIILAGIAILATEYIWARHLLNKIKSCWVHLKKHYLSRSSSPPPK